MRLIKRYSNRKLYDTTTKTYVTLEAVGAMVSRGDEIQVRDNETNEDLTSVVLSQLLLEREREQRFLPSAVLSQLWRAGKEVSSLGQTLAGLTRPLVPGSVRQFLEQEIELSFKAWLELAEGSEEELLRLLENLIERRKQARHPNLPGKTTPPLEPNPRPPTNPVTAVGTNLARAWRLRRNLDDFEDWSQEMEQTDNVKNHFPGGLESAPPASPIKPTATEISTAKNLSELQQQLTALDPRQLETLRLELNQLHKLIGQLLEPD